MERVQQAATAAPAVGVSAVGASYPAWVEYVTSPEFEAAMGIMGAVSLGLIVTINLITLYQKIKGKK